IADPVDRGRIPAAVRLLQEIREGGVAVALDDVGDDRVPLLHVTELPIDIVKLDRCLVHGIDTHHELRTVVRSLQEMCERLGRRVLAEGVETVEEETVLRRLGIRYVQGYLFAKPLGISALGGFLESRFVGFSANSVA
ncbi:MAG: EAL domain-containing protein, partial [Gemmatimonadetes bacterium]|nr:EAL domain-containing protein [Gemmatimonadota bacterium]